MKQTTLFLAAIIIPILAPAQNDIDYNDRSVYKDITKAWGITSPQIRRNAGEGDDINQGREMGDFFIITDSGNSSVIKYAWIGRINSCRSGRCLPENSNVSEYFDYFILFDSDRSVKSVRIFNYQATHGAEVTAPGWLRQFSGYRGERLLRAGRDIDAISGATVSVEAIIKDIHERTVTVKMIGE